MKKVRNLKKVDLAIDHKFWKAGDVLELTDAQWEGVQNDSDFALVEESEPEQKDQKSISAADKLEG